ncbi:hypothetical protein CSUI_001137 [Cystoisospora suis]|uniref:Transmembrane protein n=1 Tax=Cystoisospora suis TaxID=483139 RepID=A0A2C6LDP4_9APIC|nr:hypothetical protein CSUI_001137 [Cystoisospora suis]
MAAIWSGTDAALWWRRQSGKRLILWSTVVAAAFALGTVNFCFAQSEEAFALEKGNGEETGFEDLSGDTSVMEDESSADEPPAALPRRMGKKYSESQRGPLQTVGERKKLTALFLLMVSVAVAAASIRVAVMGPTVAAPVESKSVVSRAFFLGAAGALAAVVLCLQYLWPREPQQDGPARVGVLPGPGAQPSVTLPAVILTVASLAAAVVVGIRKRDKEGNDETHQLGSEKTSEESTKSGAGFAEIASRLEAWFLGGTKLVERQILLPHGQEVPQDEATQLVAAFESHLEEGTRLADQLQTAVDKSRMASEHTVSQRPATQIENCVRLLEYVDDLGWFANAITDLRMRQVLSSEKADRFEQQFEEITVSLKRVRNAFEEMRSAHEGAAESAP